jgi:non-specific serine/threonine protein kinase
VRFTLLQTVRAYARQQLEGSEEREAVHGRHATYFLALAERHPSHDGERRQNPLLLEVSRDDLRGALRWAAAQPDPDLELRLAAALWHFWLVRGPAAEGRACLEAALCRADQAAPALRQRLLLGAGILNARDGDVGRAIERLRSAHAIAQASGDSHGVAHALAWLGQVAWLHDVPEIVTELSEAVTECRRQADARTFSFLLTSVGMLYQRLDQREHAVTAFSEAFTIARAEGDTHGLAVLAWRLALIAHAEGNDVRAVELMRQALAINRGSNDPTAVTRLVATAVRLAMANGDGHERVARLCVEGQHHAALHQVPMPPQERATDECIADALRSTLGPAAFERLRSQAGDTSLDELVEEALALLELDTPTRRSGVPLVAVPWRRVALSARELEVLRLVARGRRNAEIAKDLVITARTARFHVASILKKLGASNRTQAVALARDARLFETPAD